MKKFIFIFISLLILVLSACGKYDETDNTSIDNDVDTVKNDDLLFSNTITDDFEYESASFIINSSQNLRQLFPYIYGEIVDDEEFKNILVNFELYLNSASFSPSTTAEEEMVEYLDSAHYHLKQFTNYLRLYINTKEDAYKRLSIDEYEKAKTDMEMSLEIAKKYGK